MMHVVRLVLIGDYHIITHIHCRQRGGYSQYTWYYTILLIPDLVLFIPSPYPMIPFSPPAINYERLVTGNGSSSTNHLFDSRRTELAALASSGSLVMRILNLWKHFIKRSILFLRLHPPYTIPLSWTTEYTSL